VRISVKYRKTAIVFAGLVVLYAVFGFFVLPSIVRPRLVNALEQATHRPVQMGDLAINPFALSVTVYDFELRDRDSSRLVSFARLHINYEILSLFRNAYVFSEFLLDTPYVAVRVLRDGKLSIHDLLPPAGADSSATAGPVKALVIDNFALTQGTVLYEDLSRSAPLRRDIDSLNLSLKNFTTMPREEGLYEFTATTGGGEYLHWRGNVTVTPARSAGLLEVRNLRASSLWEFMSDRLKFTIDSGLLGIRAEYDLDASRETPLFRLRNGSLNVSDLTLRDPHDSLPPVSLPVLGINGMTYQYPAQMLTLDSITVKGGELRTAYRADGMITLQDLLAPIPDPADTSHSKIQVTVNSITTSGTKFVLLEKTREPEAPLVLTDLALDLRNLCYGRPGTAQLAAKGVLNGGGTISAAGTLSLDPRKADLDISVAGTPFVALQPYASRYSRARHESGTASLQGKMSYASRNGRTMFRFRGGATLDRVRISDPVMNEDLTRWDRLELKGMDYTLTPPAVSIAEIVATRPYIRVIIAPDRTMNIQHVMAEGEDSTARASSASATPRDSAQHTATTIKGITIVDGSMNFTDLSLTPNFAVSIQEMGGTVKGLSSEQLARADVEIAGKVDKYAPATIRGQINPLSEEAYTDILMKFEGIELTTFSPYAGKFAGYKIDRGKLNLDLRYKLNKRHLEGSNKIVLDQLTLGEEMTGPDVTSMPVKLAIALLKDSHGVIDLDVPVSGSLDDPEFSFFPIILKAILNILWKIVTAPFALIGSLFGGSGEELEFVAFLPGSDSLAADQQSKLTTIAKALADRPALQLDVRGSASNTADRDAIAENTVTKKIRSSGTGPLTPAEEKRLLTLYQQTFKEEAAQLVPEGGMTAEEREQAIIEAAHRRLIASVQVTESDLRDLAQRRAAAILEYLTQQGGVDVARIFLQEAGIAVNPTEGLVRTSLSLTAR
jgi:Domain of Unknown Function (DUF748)